MKLRYLDKGDGSPPVLQEWHHNIHDGYFVDVPIEKEPRKAREWVVWVSADGSLSKYRLGLELESTAKQIRVREVLPEEK